jgi:hypothetical protein
MVKIEPVDGGTVASTVLLKVHIVVSAVMNFLVISPRSLLD